MVCMAAGTGWHGRSLPAPCRMCAFVTCDIVSEATGPYSSRQEAEKTVEQLSTCHVPSVCYLSVCLSICCLSAYLIDLSIYYLSIYLSIYLCIYLSTEL